MATVINNQKEAEKPPQSEVAGLSTEVEPKDADDGLNLNPYSPASNLNTEEMEGLLRVEEEILNSPEKANEAPKTGKEGRTRLADAYSILRRRDCRLSRHLHWQNSRCKNPANAYMLRARGKRKDQRTLRLRQTCLSVEVQPGLVQFQPGLWKSQQSQEEKPMTPRPTAATITREHRSYSEVTSAERFAVIPMGYPKALFSTKELSKVQEAILDVIRTQRQGAIKPYFTGCTFRPGWLLIS
ncbi:hypothetical protein ACLKA6_005830 [Drosophila palustris]